MSDLDRVRSLLRRAVDPGATIEEQRTSAHIAARLIVREKIGLSAGLIRERRIIVSKFVTYCRLCGDDIARGDRCSWAPECAVHCLPCHHRRAA